MSAHSYFTYAAIALFFGGMVHVIGLALGPDAIGFLGAPQEFVQDYRDGNLKHVFTVTLGIAGLLFGLAILSWRAKTSHHWVLRLILWAFALIFILRGLLVFLFVPAIMAGRNGGDVILFWFHIGASIFVLTIGIGLLVALLKTRKQRL